MPRVLGLLSVELSFIKKEKLGLEKEEEEDGQAQYAQRGQGRQGIEYARGQRCEKIELEIPGDASKVHQVISIDHWVV